MKQDPFSRLGALDQKLFQDQPDKETSKLPDKQVTSPAATESGRDPVSQSGGPPEPEAIRHPSMDAAPEPSIDAEQETIQQAPKPAGIEARRTPVSAPAGQKRPPRPEARHTYDIFQDQVRWMNRLKLDIEEIYGARVTINSIVKLGIDLVHQDHETNGERSQLIQVLVRGRPLRVRPTVGREGTR